MTSPAREVIAANLAALNLSADAQAYLIALWDLIQGLDDWVDETPIEKAEQDRTIWLATVGMHSSPFFAQHAAWLLPLVANCVLRWQAANQIESSHEKAQYAKSYMWRAGYYDIVLQVVLLTHGQETAARLASTVMKMYGETFEDYVREFDA